MQLCVLSAWGSLKGLSLCGKPSCFRGDKVQSGDEKSPGWSWSCDPENSKLTYNQILRNQAPESPTVICKWNENFLCNNITLVWGFHGENNDVICWRPPKHPSTSTSTWPENGKFDAGKRGVELSHTWKWLQPSLYFLILLKSIAFDSRVLLEFFIVLEIYPFDCFVRYIK